MTRRRRALAVLGAAALLAGCALAPAEPPMTSALIDQLPASLPHRARGAATLLVLQPQARPAYDTTQMAYSLRPHHLAYFARNQWGETPPQMLQPLLVRALDATGGFGAVVAAPFTGAASHQLQVEVVELLQDFQADPPVVRLALRAQLHELEGRRSVAAREFTLRQPMREKSPQAGVAAANEAMQDALRQIAGFVLEHAR